MKLKNLLLPLAMTMLAVVGCRKDDIETSAPQEETVIEQEKVNVLLPAEVDKSILDELVVSNAFGEYPMTASNESGNTGKSVTVGYTATIQYSPTGLIITNVINKKGEMVMCSIDDPASDPNTLIDAEKTAVALVMTHPLFITTDKTVFTNTVKYIKTLPEFSTYRNQVYQALVAGLKGLYTPDYSAINMKPLIMAVIQKHWDSANLSTNLVSINNLKRADGKYEFSIANEHKRVLHIYFKKAKVEANGVPKEEVDVLNQVSLPHLETIIPNSTDYWSLVKGSAFGDTSSPFENTTETINIDIQDYDKLAIEFYGLGKLDKPFNQYTEEQRLKMMLVAVHGAYNDFIKPMIALYLGIGDVIKSSKDDFKYDLRYGTKKSPFTDFITNLGLAFVNDQDEVQEFTQSMIKKEFGEASKQVLLFCLDQIASNKPKPRPFSAKDTYINNLYDIFKKYMGVSSVPDKARNFTKDIANQLTHKINFVANTVKIAELGTDIAGAIYAYNSTSMFEKRYLNRTDVPTVSLVTPTHNQEFLQIGEVDFKWTFDQGNHIGSTVFELTIQAMDANNTVLQTKTYTQQQTQRVVNMATEILNQGVNHYRWKVRALKQNNNSELANTNYQIFKVQGTTLPPTTHQTVLVEGGTFLMGSPNGVGYSNERPQHQVTVSTFRMSKYEVTNAQYAQFLNVKGNQTEGGNSWYDEYYGSIKKNGGVYLVTPGYENHPVGHVSWYGARAYAQWVGGRLPTEAEWEYAARGGKYSLGFFYAGSNNVGDVAWYDDNSSVNGTRTTHPVGQKQPNELGLYDMSGNVWEWCSDWYGAYSSNAQSNPTGPTTGNLRVLRGGGFNDDANITRVAHRRSNYPSNQLNYFGFRVVFP
ncbi:formylglycine-generating enzyme family protein [Bergeyella zoohelcum]|uniref:Sulfatase-modifying factor enzyme-like domain-containing protein n=1 Tax=Bergeyella zoohelcum ATCC 43767 TaxID=883096 RepID=K1MBE6_9FLAO|nr:formylglycine-generating enzyme family protein [Bergeyella zoohelcum]EKB59703.1 hypothetical protein HMPREF9699_00068 [Bergeyella zoohelcum ATCC 43767]SUV49754.1 Serine/threonine-protein kinase pkn1 [Bergeyella zoohelcum]